MTSYSSNVANVVIENAPGNAQISHQVFKKRYCIFLLEGYMLQYVKRLVFLIFVLLLMKLEMNKKENKWQ